MGDKDASYWPSGLVSQVDNNDHYVTNYKKSFFRACWLVDASSRSPQSRLGGMEEYRTQLFDRPGLFQRDLDVN